MISFNILNIALFLLHFPGDSIKAFHEQLESYMGRYIGPPPESDSAGKCYHYTELVKVEIGKSCKVISVKVSDSAPDWLQQEFNKMEKRQKIDYEKLSELAKKAGLKKGLLLFTLIIESEDFPCGITTKTRVLPSNFFIFNGSRLKGNVTFCEPLKIVWPLRYIIKEQN